MSSIPTNPDALLTRRQTATALTEAGFPTSYATLNTMATRGTGPRYYRFGPRALHRWSDALAWAQAKLSAPRSSTAEGYELDRDARAKNEPGAKACRRMAHPAPSGSHQTAAE
jgi:hypothetical protein